MKKRKHPKYIYANGVNLSGLYSALPLHMTWDSELQSWWDVKGNFEVTILGTKVQARIVTFAALTQAEVQAWTDGVAAAMRMLTRWSLNHIDYPKAYVHSLFEDFNE